MHRADVRRDHSIHPERLRVDRSRRGEALEDLEAVAGMLSGQSHRLGVRGFQSRVFDSRVTATNAEDVVVWFHGNSEEGEQGRCWQPLPAAKFICVFRASVALAGLPDLYR